MRTAEKSLWKVNFDDMDSIEENTVVWHKDVGFSKISFFWLIWVLSISKRTKKKEFSNFPKVLSQKIDF
jgi:hypothetical protein